MNLKQVLLETKYKSRLDGIKERSKNLFKKDVLHHKYYIIHGEDHSLIVISKLDRLV